MKRLIVAALTVFFFGCGMCYGENRYITSAASHWPPFVDHNIPGQGLSIEIVKEAFAVEGYTFEHKFLPWARAEYMVKLGDIDILPDTWFSEKRSTYLMFSKPYMSNQVRFIKKKGSPFEYKGIQSLNGKRVGVIIGYSYEDNFMKAKNFRREGVSGFIMNIKKLVSGRIDLTLEDEIVARSILSTKAPEFLEHIEFVTDPLTRNDLHIACGLKNPRHEEIVSAFNKGLETIMENGTYELILTSHGIHLPPALTPEAFLFNGADACRYSAHVE